MLMKIIKQVALRFTNNSQHKESQQFQEKYEKINERLHDNPGILNAIHSNLKKMQVPDGKKASKWPDCLMAKYPNFGVLFHFFSLDKQGLGVDIPLLKKRN